jgi:hypothetical protein
MFDVLKEDRAYYPGWTKFHVGDKVIHTEYPTFGTGTVMSANSDHILVHFPNRKRGAEYRAFPHYLEIIRRRPRSFQLDDSLFEI